LQQKVAPSNNSTPPESLHAVSQGRHGSVEESIFAALQSTAACLHEVTEMDDFPPPSMPVEYDITTAETAKTIAIIIRYSSEPWARAMNELENRYIKSLVYHSQHDMNELEEREIKMIF
jgi:hypothetical protein